jgi:hypothetical protein
VTTFVVPAKALTTKELRITRSGATRVKPDVAGIDNLIKSSGSETPPHSIVKFTAEADEL